MSPRMNPIQTVSFLIVGALSLGFVPGCASSPPAQASAEKAAAASAPRATRSSR